MRIRNIIFASLFMYIASILQAQIMLGLTEILGEFDIHVFIAVIMGLIILFGNFIAYLLIVIIPVVMLHKKIPFKIYDVIAISVCNYILFAIYETPFQYLFVDTSKHGGFLLVDWKDEMPYPVASFWITLQYAIVMLITLIVLKIRDRHKYDDDYDENEQDYDDY